MWRKTQNKLQQRTKYQSVYTLCLKTKGNKTVLFSNIT